VKKDIFGAKMTESKSLTVDAVFDSTPKNGGRPSKPQQLEIERTMRECFGRGYSASFAVRKTGHNIKTVTRYYDQFMEEIEQGDKEEFLARKRSDTIQLRQVHDELTDSLYQDKTDVENLIEQAKAAGDLKSLQNLYKIKLKLNQEIHSRALAKIKIGYTNRPKSLLEQYEERFNS
jgi:hypothetical protein